MARRVAANRRGSGRREQTITEKPEEEPQDNPRKSKTAQPRRRESEREEATARFHGAPEREQKAEGTSKRSKE